MLKVVSGKSLKGLVTAALTGLVLSSAIFGISVHSSEFISNQGDFGIKQEQVINKSNKQEINSTAKLSEVVKVVSKISNKLSFYYSNENDITTTMQNIKTELGDSTSENFMNGIKDVITKVSIEKEKKIPTSLEKIINGDITSIKTKEDLKTFLNLINNYNNSDMDGINIGVNNTTINKLKIKYEKVKTNLEVSSIVTQAVSDENARGVEKIRLMKLKESRYKNARITRSENQNEDIDNSEYQNNENSAIELS